MPYTLDHTSRATRFDGRAGSIAMLMALAAPLSAHAQSSRPGDASDMARMIGLSVAASGGPRDTLGLLIASVTRDGPADQAGITTGSRVLAVNGLQVRLAPSDIGRRAAADSALLKFDRALRVTPPGRDVMLRVAGGGMTRLVNVPVGERRGGAARVATAAVVADVAPPIDSTASRAVASTPTSAPVVSAPPASVRVVPSVDAMPAPVSVVAQPPITSSAPATTPSRQPRSVGALADALGDIQLELRRLARDSHSLAMSDSLAELDAAVGALRRRMRTIAPDASSAAVRSDIVTPTAPVTTAIVAPTTSAATPAAPVAPAGVSLARVADSGTPSRLGIPGLELAKVSGELAAYLGAQGDSALSVVRATEAWEPIHSGDVIIQIDGTAPDPERLRAALESHRRIGVTLLRRGRSFTVLLGDTDAH